MLLAPDALEYLRAYVYEGNVRELQGMIERAVVICEGKTIRAADFELTWREVSRSRPEARSPDFSDGQTLKCLEDEYIDYVYKKTNGSIKECSAILGIDRTTLWRRIKEKQGLLNK